MREPANLAARADMMMSSMMGAIAFQKDLGAVHSCAHALGTVVDMHHGLANGIMIDHVMRFNADAAAEKMAELARVCGAGATAGDFVAWLGRLKREVGIPAKLAEKGVTAAHIPALVEVAVKDICHQTNPKPCTADDFRRIFAGRDIVSRMDPLKIGISARLLYPDSRRVFLPTKTVQYLEQSVANWVMSGEVLAFMVPEMSLASPHLPANVTVKDYVNALDGLVLQGGADIAPESYGETPLNPAWAGDPFRDRYEISLFEEFVRQGKPVFGICRGCQLINVALGGTLLQDINTQVPESLLHRSDQRYEDNFHAMRILDGSWLASLYPGTGVTRINTIHHQAVKALGAGPRRRGRERPRRHRRGGALEGAELRAGRAVAPGIHGPFGRRAPRRQAAAGRLPRRLPQPQGDRPVRARGGLQGRLIFHPFLRAPRPPPCRP